MIDCHAKHTWTFPLCSHRCLEMEVNKTWDFKPCWYCSVCFFLNLYLWFLVQNARCGAEQTQTVTREAPTITHLPGNSYIVDHWLGFTIYLDFWISAKCCFKWHIMVFRQGKVTTTRWWRVWITTPWWRWWWWGRWRRWRQLVWWILLFWLSRFSGLLKG